MRKIYVILVDHCMKWTLLFGLKGGNYYNINRGKRITLESSQELASCLLKFNIKTLNLIGFSCILIPL